MTNTNPETGIRFGTIYMSHLDPDTADWLWTNGTNVSEEEAYKELKAEIERDADLIEEECGIAVRERDGNMPDKDYERVCETEIEAAYERLGFDGRDDYIDTRLERESENIQIDEPYIEGECEGVKYGISHLGGAALLFLLKSPYTMKARLCSPCVPNAGDCSSPDCDGYECYAPPPDWFPNSE